MTEHPIIFSTEMVRAILDGRKTQTRRIIKPQPKLSDDRYRWHWKGKEIGIDNRIEWITLDRCPYGKPGDYLWVREKFSIGSNGYFYADDADGTVKVAWSSPIHMPRQASRITLEIVNIRVERLQQITDDDAMAEGVDLSANIGTQKKMGKAWAKVRFEQGWNKLNAKRGFSWESNMWVWVIEFKKI